MEQLSYWHQTQKTKEYPRLEKDLETGVLIVGGGIAGLSAAYCLTQRGIKPVLVEADTLCAGTTGSTTGKMTLQHGVIYQNLMKKYGIGVAREFAASQAEALRFAAQTVGKYGIACQMAETEACLYALTPEEKDVLLQEYEAAKRMDILAEWSVKPSFPPKAKALLSYPGQAVLHPVRYVQGLADAAAGGGAHLYTHTKAVSVEEGDMTLVTMENGATVRCHYLIQATQYPLFDGPNVFYARLYARRDHAVALLPAGNWPEGAFINTGEPVRSIRSHMENGRRVLILVGECHAPGRMEEREGSPYDRLRDFGQSFAGECRVLAQWSAQDYETPDQVPYIGRLSVGSNIFVAAGFNKWGLLSGTLAGMMLAEMIDTGHCKYEALYGLGRPDITSSLKKTAGEVLASAGELIKSKFEGTEEAGGLEKGEGRAIRFHGKRAGAFRGEDGGVFVVDTTCTHLGTELHFNSAEKTWDCPAHGGRFQSNGKLLEGPPKDDLKLLFQGSYPEYIRALHGGDGPLAKDAPNVEDESMAPGLMTAPDREVPGMGEAPLLGGEPVPLDVLEPWPGGLPPGSMYGLYPSHPPRGREE